MRTSIFILVLLLSGVGICRAELQIIFEEQTIDLSPTKGGAKSAVTEQVVLRIGVDYFYTIRDGLIKNYDFAKKKIVYVRNDKKIDDVAMHAVAAERLEGLIADMEVYQAMARADVLEDKSRFAIFNIESYYGIQSDVRSAIKPTKSAAGSQKYSYNLGADMIASHGLSKHGLVREELERFEQFLLYECRLHPEIRKDIMVYRKIPERLIYRTRKGSKKKETALTLVSSKRVKDTVLTEEILSASRPPSDELETIFVEALNNEEQNRLSGQDYNKMFNASIERKYFLDAMLIAVEVYLQTGESTANSMDILRPYMEVDPDLGRFVSGLNVNDRKSAAISLSILEDIDPTKIFRQHILQTSQANALKFSNKYVAAEKRYLEAIRSNPYLTGIYIDLGDLYYRMHLMDKAWGAWQMAKDLNPKHPMLDNVFSRNIFIEEAYPDFF